MSTIAPFPMTKGVRETMRMVLFRPCALCHGPAEGVHGFAPDDPEAWGAARGKRRLYFASVCERCEEKATAEEWDNWFWLHHGDPTPTWNELDKARRAGVVLFVDDGAGGLVPLDEEVPA